MLYATARAGFSAPDAAGARPGRHDDAHGPGAGIDIRPARGQIRLVGRSSPSGREARMAGRMRKKSELPTKVCPVCNRPFAWRRKWAAVWDEVRYCSDACRRARPADAAPRPVPGRG